MDKSKIKNDLIISKALPNNAKEIIIVIPEIVDEEEHYFELNSYILIVNNETGKIINTYFESSTTNNWVSDAVVLTKITIDTAPYKISEKNRAFGIRVHYYGMSKANPYSNTTISLFIKSKNTLKRILKNYDVMDYGGEWDTDCIGEFIDHKKTLIITASKTNSYYNILAKNKITKTKNYIDKNNDCDSMEKVTTMKTVLKYNGEEYIEKTLQ
ncbi:hypothetical protein [Aquimarina sp. MAR_2010_214]|uniref:hypothetical protein n=1 Tax=Aquimarina sp. MAR_2010_214 TaxID=1250026 RepID=UPI001177B15D|nr:hypothetical protein [Aquimarina sp. MAR_2010_214]